MKEKTNPSKDEYKNSDISSENMSELKEAQESKKSEPEDKVTKDCRDHCMHCGSHCIYLKKD